MCEICDCINGHDYGTVKTIIEATISTRCTSHGIHTIRGGSLIKSIYTGSATKSCTQYCVQRIFNIYHRQSTYRSRKPPENRRDYWRNVAKLLSGSPQETALSVASRPSVCSCLRFSRKRKATETSSLVETSPWSGTRVTRRANLRFIGQRSRSLGTKM